jgi:competence protein CoiA
MLYAMINGVKRKAAPGWEATCPSCGAVLIAKCGEINAWHWSHAANTDCDSWSEPESEWHLSWKRLAGPDACEVVMGSHRADMVSPATGFIVELQHSSLPPCQVAEREAFYRKMIWLVNAEGFEDRLDFRDRGDHVTFRWKHIRKWMLSIHKPMFWDLGGGRLFVVKKLHPNTRPGYNRDGSSHKGFPSGGWGKFVHEGDFMDWLFPNDPEPLTP